MLCLSERKPSGQNPNSNQSPTQTPNQQMRLKPKPTPEPNQTRPTNTAEPEVVARTQALRLAEVPFSGPGCSGTRRFFTRLRGLPKSTHMESSWEKACRLRAYEQTSARLSVPTNTCIMAPIHLCWDGGLPEKTAEADRNNV